MEFIMVYTLPILYVLLMPSVAFCSAFLVFRASTLQYTRQNMIGYAQTQLHSAKSQYSEARLYKVQRGQRVEINTHISKLHRIIPEIIPDPPVVDEVEEYYATSYETYRFFPRHKEEITISLRKPSFGCGKLGSALWKCALGLSCHLVSMFDDREEVDLQSMRMLELGAGLGLLSCVCREMGVGKVMATDFWEDTMSFGKSLDKERLIPHKLFGVNLDFNVVKYAGIESQRRDADTITVDKLDWNNEVDAFRTKMIYDPTLIVASDVVYNADDCLPLVRTLELLMGGEASTETPVEAILWLDHNERKEKEVNEFRVALNKMIGSHSGWRLAEEQYKLCYWMDEGGGFEEEYSILEIKLANDKVRH
jgi:hypothetical protein